ncbi:MAG: lipopolysaccharide heptosyltransferase II [candidate division WOR-3 bacterium]
MKILVRFPNWLGDAIFARGFLKALLERYPDSEIHVLIKENLKEIVWDFKSFTFKNKKDLFLLLFKIKKQRFDISYILPNSFSSAFFTFLYGIRERIGYENFLRNIFLTKSLKIEKDYKKKHIINSYLKLIGLEYNEKYKPDFPLKDINFKLDFKNYVVFAPFASFGPSKEWPKEYYIKLGEIFENNNFKVIILGSKKDVKKFEKWEKKFIDFVGKLNLIEVSYLIKNSKIFIGNDSGLFHLANALDIPSIGIYGSSSPLWTGPLSKNSIYIYKNLECSPCFKRKCFKKENKYECLYKIKPEEVFEISREKLRKK